MKREQALAFVLAKRFLGEFIPGPLRSDFEVELAYAHQQIAEDQELGQWLDQIDQVETWQGLLEPPDFKKGVLYGISTALFEGQQLRIQYRQPDGTTRNYHIHPLGLVKRNQIFYLVATFFNFNDPRLLLLHRIEMAWPQSEQPRYIPSEFNLTKYLSNGFPLALDEEEELTIKLLFRESAYRSLIEQPLRGTDVKIDPPADGWFQVTGKVPNIMELRWWLLGFNDQVRIMEPSLLAMELQNLLFDLLTGLIMRRATQEHLDRLLAASQRKKQSLALIMVDVDHFKGVNDTCGHDGGDAILKEVAARLKKTCREMDVVGRWGGEEFLIVLPDTNETEALTVAERFRAAVAEAPIPIPDPKNTSVTVSLGVRCVQPTDMKGAEKREADRNRLLKEADDALYKAKHDGRNRVCKWDETTPSYQEQ